MRRRLGYWLGIEETTLSLAKTTRPMKKQATRSRNELPAGCRDQVVE